MPTAHPEAFGTSGPTLTNALPWYGAECGGTGPTLGFRTAGSGAFCAHCYPYTATLCTFVMECAAAASEICAFGPTGDVERQAICEVSFRDDLEGYLWISNNSVWRNFQPVENRKWVHGYRGLIGDAVHRAYFSIGSGTRIAMKDTIALVEALSDQGDVPTALQSYVASRKPRADSLLSAARESSSWYEDMARHMARTPWTTSPSTTSRGHRQWTRRGWRPNNSA